MELRFRNDGTISPRVEVCDDDQWYALDSSINVDDSPVKIVEAVAVDSTSVKITFNLFPPLDNATYLAEVSCTTTALGGDQFTKTTAIVGKTTWSIMMAHISGLSPDTVYNCCVMIQYLKDLPLNFTANTCTLMKTLAQLDKVAESGFCSCISTTGLGIALGVVTLLSAVVAVGCAYVATLAHRSKNKEVPQTL